MATKKKVGVGGFIGNIPPQSQVPMSLQGALAGGGANPPMAAPPVMSQPGMGPMPPGLGDMPPGPPMLPKKPAPKKRGKPKAKAKNKTKAKAKGKKALPKKAAPFK